MPCTSARAVTLLMMPLSESSGPSPSCPTHGDSAAWTAGDGNVSSRQERADSSPSLPNCIRPPTPSWLVARGGSARPCADHSPVPSAAEARRARSPNSCRTARHASRSSAASSPKPRAVASTSVESAVVAERQNRAWVLQLAGARAWGHVFVLSFDHRCRWASRAVADQLAGGLPGRPRSECRTWGRSEPTLGA
jgi:hypothetical protein